jgi:hypothetical protein
VREKAENYRKITIKCQVFQKMGRSAWGGGSSGMNVGSVRDMRRKNVGNAEGSESRD